MQNPPRALGVMPCGGSGPIRAASARVGFDAACQPVPITLADIGAYLEAVAEVFC